MRWLVGDVHGCVRELEDLVEAIGFDPSRDELWCVGDLINGGPDSLGTLRLWQALGGLGVIGNHEVYTLCAHSGRWPRKRDTLDDVYGAPDAEALLASLRALPMLQWLPGDQGGPDAWAVHGGVSPQWTDLHAVVARQAALVHDDDWLESDEVSFATRARCCSAEGQRHRYDHGPEGCPEGFSPWDALYRGEAMVVHGHWARRGHYRGQRTIGLDSGCVYGGPLTAWCQQEDRIVQVPSRLQ
ncbi:MAG: metallophosphoesterase [Deltaproteobacteria bacterium]|nr:metallophosphoesterase [Deltaproteobacteria bacterium]